MPLQNHKVIVVEDNNPHDDLGHDDANTSADGNPSKHVDGANRITLFLVRLSQATHASKTYHSSRILLRRQYGSPMVLPSSSWIPGTQLCQTQRRRAHQKENDDAAIDDCHWPSLEDGEEHGRGHTGPTIADIESSREHLQGTNRPWWMRNLGEDVDFPIARAGCDGTSVEHNYAGHHITWRCICCANWPQQPLLEDDSERTCHLRMLLSWLSSESMKWGSATVLFLPDGMSLMN